MPVPVKNAKKPLTPKRKYSRNRLETIKRNNLKAFCKKKNLPYVRLSKSQLIDNIISWQSGNGIKFPELTRTWEEVQNANHKISPYMRKFCLDYTICTKRKTQKEWGVDFGVSGSTINMWLSWQEVKDLIEAYRYSIDDRVIERIAQSQETAVVELVALIIGKKVPPETKRKAICNLLGFGGRVDVNAAKVSVVQQQAQGQKQDYSNLTDEELSAAMKEMDELENG